jgi:hypothetical protein
VPLRVASEFGEQGIGLIIWELYADFLHKTIFPNWKKGFVVDSNNYSAHVGNNEPVYWIEKGILLETVLDRLELLRDYRQLPLRGG